MRYIIKTFTPNVSLPWPNNILDPVLKIKNDFWITKEGEIIYPADMSDTHLVNTIAMIHRKRTHFRDVFSRFPYMDQLILYGPKAISYFPSSKYSKAGNRQYKTYWEDDRQYMRLRQEAIARGLGEYIK